MALDVDAESSKAAPPKTVERKTTRHEQRRLRRGFRHGVRDDPADLYNAGSDAQSDGDARHHRGVARRRQGTVYDSTQGIFGVQKKIGVVFGLAPDNVRVISHYVGGGFGSKGSPWSHIAFAVMAAKVTGRAVKRDDYPSRKCSRFVGHRPLTKQDVSLGADATGKLLAVKHENLSYTSTIDEFIEPAASGAHALRVRQHQDHTSVGEARPVDAHVHARAGRVHWNLCPRVGDGRASLCAQDGPVNVTPRKLRRQRSRRGARPWSSKELRRCYQRAAEKFGWSKRKPAPRSMRDGRFLVGQGMATATYPANQPDSSAVVAHQCGTVARSFKPERKTSVRARIRS